MRVPAFVVALLLCPAICSSQSVMIGKRLVAQGDTAARVREIAGAPDRLDAIAGDASSPPIEIWTYRRKENTVVLFVVDAKVVHTQEKPAQNRIAADAADGATLRTAPSGSP